MLGVFNAVSIVERGSTRGLTMTTRREFLGTSPAVGAAFAVSGGMLFEEGSAQAQQAAALFPGHFHPKGKAPSTHTLKVLQAARSGLPFDDTRDLEEQTRGLIATMPERKIMADAGHVASDMEQFQFLETASDFDRVHALRTINRADLEKTMTGDKTLDAQIRDGSAKMAGDVSVLGKLAAAMADFDPRFEIMAGTNARGDVAHAPPYAAVTGPTIAA